MKRTSDPLQQGDTRGPLVDLRRIRQFVVLTETLNFRRAAERLHMAQPPLSVSIQKLEAELGVRLFDRGGSGGVTLTAGGQAALVEARRLLFHSAQLREAVSSATDGIGGALRVGFVGSSTNGVLQRIVRLFRAEYPGVKLVLHEGSSVHLMEQVDAGELDVGLVRTPVLVSANVTLTPVLSEDFMAALPAGSELAQRPELYLRDLASESFVFYSGAGTSGLHAMAILACQLAGFLPRVTQTAAQVQTVLALVESGLGVALVPSIMEHTPNPRIAYRRLADIPPQARIGLALALQSTQARPAAQRFRDLVVASPLNAGMGHLGP